MPLHDHADLVQVSDDYAIYRLCYVALTERGRSKQQAAQFIEFLKSPDGARVFESWQWMIPAAGSRPLTEPEPPEVD